MDLTIGSLKEDDGFIMLKLRVAITQSRRHLWKLNKSVFLAFVRLLRKHQC